MKISPRDTGSFLKSPGNHRSVLFFGPDEGLIREHRKTVTAALVSDPSDPMSATQFHADTIKSEPSLLYEAMAAISLLGDTSIIVIEQATDKLAPILKEAFDMPECQNYVIVCGGDLPPRSPLRGLYEKDKSLAAIGCYKDEGASLQNVIRDHFTTNQIQCDRDCMAFLTSRLGNDRGVTLSELEKISLYLGEEKTLTLEVAEHIIGHNDNKNLDDIAFALADGKLSHALHMTEQQMAEGAQPIMILRSLMRYFDRLKLASLHMQDGKSTDEAMSMLQPPVFFKQKPYVKRHLSQLRKREIDRILSLLMDAERAIKHNQEPKTTCLHFLTRIASRRAA